MEKLLKEITKYVEVEKNLEDSTEKNQALKDVFNTDVSVEDFIEKHVPVEQKERYKSIYEGCLKAKEEGKPDSEVVRQLLNSIDNIDKEEEKPDNEIGEEAIEAADEIQRLTRLIEVHQRSVEILIKLAKKNNLSRHDMGVTMSIVADVIKILALDLELSEQQLECRTFMGTYEGIKAQL